MKYPIVLQRNCNDCGPACIYSLCKYYNIPYNQKDILSLVEGVDSDAVGDIYNRANPVDIEDGGDT